MSNIIRVMGDCKVHTFGLRDVIIECSPNVSTCVSLKNWLLAEALHPLTSRRAEIVIVVLSISM